MAKRILGPLAKRLEAVKAWDAAKQQLQAAKDAELAARGVAIAACFTKAQLRKAGTYHCLLYDGSKLKLELRRAAKVDADKILNALSRLKQVAGAVKGKLLGERLISWKPAASLTELAKFEPAHAKVFKGVITIELASPSLELTPPPAT